MTGKSSTGYLRNSPRQARSAARVERLLDAAEAVFEEVGYDAATTNLVAARADVPVGTLYRWFPDKGALAEALTDRYIHDLLGMYDELLSTLTPAEHMSDFLREVMAAIVERARSLPALPALLVSTMVPGRRSDAGTRLRVTLTEHVGAIIDLRVPGIPADVRDDTAQVCVAFTYLVISAATDDGGRRLADEYVDALIAYLEAKFPDPDDPVWSEADPAVAPRFPAPNRVARLAAAQADDGGGSST